MLGDITEVHVQQATPQATITMQKHVPVQVLQNAISKAGSYIITESGMVHAPDTAEKTGSWFETYKPVLLIGLYLVLTTLVIQAGGNEFNAEEWMRHFMAGFFLVFSFFKLLDLRGFADAYSSYDIIAKKWPGWGYLYPFIELGLGFAYLFNQFPLLTNIISFVIMSISIIGVLQSVMSKRTIQCACLGAVFNLPMSTITIIEDGLMILMSGYMIFHII